MLPIRRFASVALGWLLAITGLHLAVNVDWKTVLNSRLPRDQRKFNVAYIPVT